jgi:ABC-type Na+ efflux pump permease subunit
MTLYFRRAPIWIVLNLIGMGTYLRLGSELWTVPGDEGLPGGPGDPFYWFFLMLPILLVYLVFNLISLSAIIERVRQTGRLNSLYVWLTIAMFWIVTFRYDNLRSFRVICPAAGC